MMDVCKKLGMLFICEISAAVGVGRKLTLDC